MKRFLLLLTFTITTLFSFAQFADTSQLNGFIRDTIKDRRPDKVTASQIQKGMLGISKFLVTDKNFASNNLAATGNRTHDFSGYSLKIDSFSTFNLNMKRREAAELAEGVFVKGFFSMNNEDLTAAGIVSIKSETDLFGQIRTAQVDWSALGTVKVTAHEGDLYNKGETFEVGNGVIKMNSTNTAEFGNANLEVSAQDGLYVYVPRPAYGGNKNEFRVFEDVQIKLASSLGEYNGKFILENSYWKFIEADLRTLWLRGDSLKLNNVPNGTGSDFALNIDANGYVKKGAALPSFTNVYALPDWGPNDTIGTYFYPTVYDPEGDGAYLKSAATYRYNGDGVVTDSAFTELSPWGLKVESYSAGTAPQYRKAIVSTNGGLATLASFNFQDGGTSQTQSATYTANGASADILTTENGIGSLNARAQAGSFYIWATDLTFPGPANLGFLAFSQQKLFLNRGIEIDVAFGDPTTTADRVVNSLILKNPYTPSSSTAEAQTGAFAWDDTKFYIKTSAGWKYVNLTLVGL